MDRLLRCAAVAAASFTVLLTACGGGHSSPVDSSVSTNETVQGVSTPSSVSVVTAKNANSN